MEYRITSTQDFQIDGLGSASAWSKLPWLPLTRVGKGESTYGTRSKMVYSSTGVYFLIECEDKKLTCTMTKDQSDIYTVAYYVGTQRVRRKFSDLAKARREAELIAIKLANGETEALKLTGGDHADYVRAMEKLRAWKPDADLNLAITSHGPSSPTPDD